MKYLLGTGYHDHKETIAEVFYRRLFELWYVNTLQYSDPPPTHIVCLACGGCCPPLLGQQNVLLDGDIGHVLAVVDRTKPHLLNGGEATILALAMLAYNDESDFIYKEQDCFAFGPWVRQMYEEIGDAGMIHGKHLDKDPGFIGFCLVLIKHRFIPTFIAEFIKQNRPNSRWLLESTIIDMAKRLPGEIKQVSFGYDRDRPFNKSDKVWYIQTQKEDELHDLIKSRHLVFNYDLSK